MAVIAFTRVIAEIAFCLRNSHSFLYDWKPTMSPSWQLKRDTTLSRPVHDNPSMNVNPEGRRSREALVNKARDQHPGWLP